MMRRTRRQICGALLLLALLVSAAPAQEEIVSSGEVRFVGNHSMGEGELRAACVDDLKDLETRGYRRSNADDTAFQVESYYHSQGFPQATVEYRIEVESGHAVVTLVVVEGPQILLRNVAFTGNQHFSSEELRALLESPRRGLLGMGSQVFAESDIASLADSIALAYYRDGFLDVRVEEPEIEPVLDGAQRDVRITLHEGIRYRVTRFDLAGYTAFTREELQASLATMIGLPYSARRSYEARARIQELYAEQGYSSTRVAIQAVLEGDEGSMVLQADIEEGPQVRLRSIRVTGNEDTRESFILERIPLEPGDLLKLSAQRTGSRRLFGTGLFEKVEMQVDGDGELRDLVIEVEELPSVEVSLSPGYGSYEQLRLKAGILERSFLGTGRLVRAEALVSQVGETLQAGITDPWFLGTEVTADLAGNYRRREEPSFTVQDSGVGTFLKRALGPDWAILVGYQFRLSQTSDVDVAQANLAEDLLIGSASIELTTDTRNDFFNPSEGYRASVRVEYGDRFLASELDFFRTQFTASYSLRLLQDLVLALHAQTGFVIPLYDTDVIPLQERFFNGGERTVRAFKESELGPADAFGEPLGGETLNVANAEFRYQITDEFQIAAFYDIGNVGLDFDRYFHDFRGGPGAGLRYLLPIGAVRLDAGFNPTRRRGEDSFVVHLSVGMAF